MKKLISILSAITVIMTASCSTAAADNSIDLYALATSLGADTDYINIPNTFYKSVDYDDLARYNLYNVPSFQPIVSTSASDMLASEVSNLYSDSSLGTSILEVLSHNGVLLPSDIKAGADTLREIDSYDEIKDNIEYYSSVLKNNWIFNLYYNYMLNRISKADRIDRLVDMAEKSMKEGKYFLVMYGCFMEDMGAASVSSEDGKYVIEYDNAGLSQTQQTHSAAGIGITDGKWEFEGKTYDKCVLTVDSLSEKGFSEDTCLYINSQTKDFYVPAFSGSVQGELHAVSFDDTQMLNFNGSIKPTQDYPLDDFNITSISAFGGNRLTMDISCIENDGGSTVYNYGEANNYYSYLYNYYVLNTKNAINVDCINDWYNTYGFRINDKDKFAEVNFKNHDGSMTMEDGAFTFTKSADSDSNVYHNPSNPFHIGIEIKYYDKETAPVGRRIWYFVTNTNEDVKFTPAENGFYAETSGKSQITYNISDYEGEETDLSVYTERVKSKTAAGMVDLSAGKVLISIKDNLPCVYMDNDGDGVFDDECRRGDANGDGKLDAADASLIMERYAKMSSVAAKIKEIDDDTYVISPYYDVNDDGVIDASDASAILAEYAHSST